MSVSWFHDLTELQRAMILGGLVACVMAAGAAVIMVAHRALRRPVDDRVDWAKTLVDYKNLRDDGVLSDEEYRKIRTLVEPRGGLVGPGRPDRRPAVDDHGRHDRPSRN